MRTPGGTALLPKPSVHRAGPGEGKTYKRGAKEVSLSPAHWGVLLFASLDQRALTP